MNFDKSQEGIKRNEADGEKNTALDNGDTENILISPEEKLEKFKRIGSRRVSNACKSIRLIGNLANRSAYAYEDQHVNKMFEAIEKAVAETKAKFQTEEKSSDKEFHFD